MLTLKLTLFSSSSQLLPHFLALSLCPLRFTCLECVQSLGLKNTLDKKQAEDEMIKTLFPATAKC